MRRANVFVNSVNSNYGSFGPRLLGFMLMRCFVCVGTTNAKQEPRNGLRLPSGGKEAVGAPYQFRAVLRCCVLKEIGKNTLGTFGNHHVYRAGQMK